jgi:CRISPR-associated protein Cmr4
MSQPHQLYLLHAVTPLHVGIEDSLGGVDLPTMKERHTGYPLVPGSSVKGVLRTEAAPQFKTRPEEGLAAFGPDSTASGDFRGGLVFTDALLLALPVRSLSGTFAWVTCGQILRRLARDLSVCPGFVLPEVPSPSPAEALVAGVEYEPPTEGEAKTVRASSSLVIEDGTSRRVFLEESVVTARPEPSVGLLAEAIGGWLWPRDADAIEFFRDRFLLVHEDVFGYLVRLGLEVRARVKIDRELGTAADTGPWSEEHMPAETVLYGLVMGRGTTYVERPSDDAKEAKAAPAGGEAAGGDGAELEKKAKRVRRTAEENLDYLNRLTAQLRLLRFGGHSTVGLGRAYFQLVPEANGGGTGAAPQSGVTQ